MQKLLAILIFFICLDFSSAQDSLKNPVIFSAKPVYGFILPHSAKVKHLAYTRPFGAEFGYAKLMLKERNWQQCHCYSITGISFLFVDFNNPEILGRSYNLMGFAEPLLLRSKGLVLSARMGAGLSFIEKIYDKDNNPENKFFSTHLSYIVHLDVNVYYALNGPFNLVFFSKYNHISNGGVRQPNYGMNFPMFGLGLSYSPGGPFVYPSRPKKGFNAGYFYSMNFYGMIKKVRDTVGGVEKGVGVFGAYFLAGRTISNLNGLSLGIEYLNDGGAREKIKQNNLSVDYQQVSALLGHHLIFGKFDFAQFMGIYIYAPYWEKVFFQRYTLSYALTRRFKAGVTLKSHGDVADSFHLLAGVSF